MHGAHLGIARTIQPATLPLVKVAEKTGAAPESFGASWAKAIQASASVSAKTPEVSTSKDKFAAILEKQTAVPNKKDEVAATWKKPDAAEEPEENLDAAVDLTKAVKAQTAAAANVTAALQPAAKDGVEAEAPKKTLGADDKDAASEKKRKAVKDVDVNTDAETTPHIDVTVTVTNLTLPIAPVIAAAVAQEPVSAPITKSDGKAAAKVDAAAGKRDRPAVAKTDGTTKTSGDEAKPATFAGDAEVAPITEAKEKPAEAAALPMAAHMAIASSVSASELREGMAQGTVALVAPAPAHKAETPTVQSSVDVQSNIPVTGADASGVQALAAGPGQLEIGVLDGTHGWLKIRAEMGTDGSVTAQLTSSAVAHEGLKETVPAMTGYLNSESLNVSNIAVHRAAETSATGTDLANAGGGSRDGSGERGFEGQGYQGGRGLPPQSDSGVATEQDSNATMSGISAAVFGAGARFSGNGIGSWLSVTA